MSRAFVRTVVGALALAASVAVAPAASAQVFDARQREAIEKIVKDYLIAHPEVLQEAIGELERRQQEAQKVAQSAGIREMRETIAKTAQVGTGNPQGDVTLVEFFDYNCGYCKRALGDVQALAKSDPKLRIVLKDLAVLGPDSVEASRVALAVAQQISGEKMFDYHVRLLGSRGRANGERALAVAKEMGLDMARLQRDLDAPVVKAAIQDNAALAEKLGINGTPAFILGDEVISGAVGQEPLRQAIASVRRCGQAAC
ncbi:MAG: DsbA family protein [Methylobacteriaceae bacterium]|nr:DsbA family protein [Methylobacteriaceae bacterium]